VSGSGLVRLSPSEVRAAAAAGYLSTPAPGRAKSNFFGGMFSWVTGLRFNGAPFFPVGGRAKPPINQVGSNTGQSVSPETALTLSAVWACVWLNARTMASLPLDLKRYGAGGKTKPETSDPLYNVLRWKPNRDSTAYDFWCCMWASEQLWGTGYAEIIRNGGKVVALEFLSPQFMTAYLTDKNELRFRHLDPLRQRDFAARDIFRVFTRSLDGLVGASVVEFARNSLGLAQSGELAASKIFKKGLNASGFVATEKFLTKSQRDTFTASIDEFAGDGPKAGGTMVLEGGSKYHQLSMMPEDVELLSSRQFSVEDVCRWFSTPPILIGHASQGQTMWGSGIEQIFAGWARLGLRPFTTVCSQRVKADLLPAADREELFAEYDLDDLLAGDSAARAALYASLLQNGVYTRDEVREREGLSSIPGGNVATVQSNMIPLDQLGKVIAGGGGPAQKLRNSLLELLALEIPPARKEEP
jgi:HK97 family phage portal protein